MAKVKWHDPVRTLTGKLGQDSQIIFRQKTIRDEQGRILQVLPQEAYVIENPRDWKKKPPTGAEKLRAERWQQACRQTKDILADEEQKALWRKRFEAQLKHPDPEASVNRRTHNRKTYTRLDCFIRAILFNTKA